MADGVTVPQLPTRFWWTSIFLHASVLILLYVNVIYSKFIPSPFDGDLLPKTREIIFGSQFSKNSVSFELYITKLLRLLLSSRSTKLFCKATLHQSNEAFFCTAISSTFRDILSRKLFQSFIICFISIIIPSLNSRSPSQFSPRQILRRGFLCLVISEIYFLFNSFSYLISAWFCINVNFGTASVRRMSLITVIHWVMHFVLGWVFWKLTINPPLIDSV